MSYLNFKCETIRFIFKGIPPKRLMVGVGHSSVDETVEMIREALKYNVLAVLWHPPYYFKNLSEDGVVAFYHQALQKVNDKDIKVVLYNFPMFTGVPMTHGIIEKIYNLYPNNIIGIKN